jgi:hypothetical protein
MLNKKTDLEQKGFYYYIGLIVDQLGLQALQNTTAAYPQ